MQHYMPPNFFLREIVAIIFILGVFGFSLEATAERKMKSTYTLDHLTELQYRVTQKDGTEPAFRNAYWDNKKDGIYVDIISGDPLFSSKDKFKSGTGWPSFTKPITGGHLRLLKDTKFFMTRVEIRSQKADSHLGHLFEDGPKDKGGKRYCINSASLRFVPKDQLQAEGLEELLALFE